MEFVLQFNSMKFKKFLLQEEVMDSGNNKVCG